MKQFITAIFLCIFILPFIAFSQTVTPVDSFAFAGVHDQNPLKDTVFTVAAFDTIPSQTDGAGAAMRVLNGKVIPYNTSVSSTTNFYGGSVRDSSCSTRAGLSASLKISTWPGTTDANLTFMIAFLKGKGLSNSGYRMRVAQVTATTANINIQEMTTLTNNVLDVTTITAFTIAAGDVFKFEIVGDASGTMNIYQNGTKIITGTNTAVAMQNVSGVYNYIRARHTTTDPTFDYYILDTVRVTGGGGGGGGGADVTPPSTALSQTGSTINDVFSFFGNSVELPLNAQTGISISRLSQMTLSLDGALVRTKTTTAKTDSILYTGQYPGNTTWGPWSVVNNFTTGTYDTSVHHLLICLNDGKAIFYDDSAHGYTLLKTVSIPTDSSTGGVRGVAVDLSTSSMYVAYGNDGFNNISGAHGSLLKYNLLTDAVVWKHTYTHGVDSHDMSGNSAIILSPQGEGYSTSLWYPISAFTGADTLSPITTNAVGPHNTILSLNKQHVYFGGRDPNNSASADSFVCFTSTNPYTKVASISTSAGEASVTRLGVRPFMVTGSESFAFTTHTNFLGFKIWDIRTIPWKFYGIVDLTKLGYNGTTSISPPSHGLCINPSETRLYLLDQPNELVHVFNISGVYLGEQPILLKDIPLTVSLAAAPDSGCVYDCTKVGWLSMSADGAYIYVGESGDVISTATNTVIKNLYYLKNTRHMIPVDWKQGTNTFLKNATRQGMGLVPDRTVVGAPVQLNPFYGSTVNATTDTLRIRKVPNANQYEFDYADDSLFTVNVIKDSTRTDTTKPLSGLTSSHKYYWRARSLSSPFAVGTHTATLTATDSTGNVGSITIPYVMNPTTPPPPAGSFNSYYYFDDQYDFLIPNWLPWPQMANGNFVYFSLEAPQSSGNASQAVFFPGNTDSIKFKYGAHYMNKPNFGNYDQQKVIDDSCKAYNIRKLLATYYFAAASGNIGTILADSGVGGKLDSLDHNIMTWLRRWNYDGLIIDWESTVSGPAQQQQLASWTKRLHDSLATLSPPGYLAFDAYPWFWWTQAGATGHLTGLGIGNQGQNYTTATVVIDSPGFAGHTPTGASNTWKRAKATAVISGGHITSLTIASTDSGAGYWYDNTLPDTQRMAKVHITGDGTGATAFATYGTGPQFDPKTVMPNITQLHLMDYNMFDGSKISGNAPVYFNGLATGGSSWSHSHYGLPEWIAATTGQVGKIVPLIPHENDWTTGATGPSFGSSISGGWVNHFTDMGDMNFNGIQVYSQPYNAALGYGYLDDPISGASWAYSATPNPANSHNAWVIETQTSQSVKKTYMQSVGVSNTGIWDIGRGMDPKFQAWNNQVNSWTNTTPPLAVPPKLVQFPLYNTVFNTNTVIVPAASIPILVSPINSVLINRDSVTLVFNTAANASYYTVRLTDNTGTLYYTSTSISKTAPSGDTSFIVPKSLLPYNTTMNWTAQGFNNGGVSGGISTTGIFLTKTSPITTVPLAPVLSAPINGATNVTSPITFSWLKTSDSVNYVYQIKTDTTQGCFFCDTLINSLSVTLNGFGNLKTYYWRVHSVNTYDGFSSPWTPWGSFTTKDTTVNIVSGSYPLIYTLLNGRAGFKNIDATNLLNYASLNNVFTPTLGRAVLCVVNKTPYILFDDRSVLQINGGSTFTLDTTKLMKTDASNATILNNNLVPNNTIANHGIYSLGAALNVWQTVYANNIGLYDPSSGLQTALLPYVNSLYNGSFYIGRKRDNPTHSDTLVNWTDLRDTLGQLDFNIGFNQGQQFTGSQDIGNFQHPARNIYSNGFSLSGNNLNSTGKIISGSNTNTPVNWNLVGYPDSASISAGVTTDTIATRKYARISDFKGVRVSGQPIIGSGDSVTIVAGANQTITQSHDTINISSTGGGAGVSSFNTRTGAVTPQSFDYTINQTFSPRTQRFTFWDFIVSGTDKAILRNSNGIDDIMTSGWTASSVGNGSAGTATANAVNFTKPSTLTTADSNRMGFMVPQIDTCVTLGKGSGYVLWFGGANTRSILSPTNVGTTFAFSFKTPSVVDSIYHAVGVARIPLPVSSAMTTLDTTTVSSPGAWIEFNSITLTTPDSLYAVTENASGKTKQGICAFTSSTWYDFDIVINSSSITFHQYTAGTNTVIVTKTITTNLPAQSDYAGPFWEGLDSDKANLLTKGTTMDYYEISK